MASTVGRNDPCPCGSGKKYKQCCFKKGPSASSPTSRWGMIIIGALLLVGLVFIGLSLTVGGGGNACPPGTTWSADHGHCH